MNFVKEYFKHTWYFVVQPNHKTLLIASLASVAQLVGVLSCY